MQDKLKKYLNNAGLNLTNVEVGEKFAKDLSRMLMINPDTFEDVEKLLTYQVPKLGPDGNYSILDQLDETPYKLKEILLYNNFSDEEIHKFIFKLNRVVEFLHNEIGANWTGIYKKLDTQTGPALIKLAYRGVASRVEFPLTAKFAEHSNNSTVGLSGKAVSVGSVRRHLKQGKPYYKLDERVQSELCLPIFSKDGEIIGTMELESFQENFFDDSKMTKAAIACILLSAKL